MNDSSTTSPIPTQNVDSLTSVEDCVTEPKSESIPQSIEEISCALIKETFKLVMSAPTSINDNVDCSPCNKTEMNIRTINSRVRSPNTGAEEEGSVFPENINSKQEENDEMGDLYSTSSSHLCSKLSHTLMASSSLSHNKKSENRTTNEVPDIECDQPTAISEIFSRNELANVVPVERKPMETENCEKSACIGSEEAPNITTEVPATDPTSNLHNINTAEVTDFVHNVLEHVEFRYSEEFMGTAETILVGEAKSPTVLHNSFILPVEGKNTAFIGEVDDVRSSIVDNSIVDSSIVDSSIVNTSTEAQCATEPIIEDLENDVRDLESIQDGMNKEKFCFTDKMETVESSVKETLQENWVILGKEFEDTRDQLDSYGETILFSEAKSPTVLHNSFILPVEGKNTAFIGEVDDVVSSIVDNSIVDSSIVDSSIVNASTEAQCATEPIREDLESDVRDLESIQDGMNKEKFCFTDNMETVESSVKETLQENRVVLGKEFEDTRDRLDSSASVQGMSHDLLDEEEHKQAEDQKNIAIATSFDESEAIMKQDNLNRLSDLDIDRATATVPQLLDKLHIAEQLVKKLAAEKSTVNKETEREIKSYRRELEKVRPDKETIALRCNTLNIDPAVATVPHLLDMLTIANDKNQELRTDISDLYDRLYHNSNVLADQETLCNQLKENLKEKAEVVENRRIDKICRYIERLMDRIKKILDEKGITLDEEVYWSPHDSTTVAEFLSEDMEHQNAVKEEELRRNVSNAGTDKFDEDDEIVLPVGGFRDTLQSGTKQKYLEDKSSESDPAKNPVSKTENKRAKTCTVQ